MNKELFSFIDKVVDSKSSSLVLPLWDIEKAEFVGEFEVSSPKSFEEKVIRYLLDKLKDMELYIPLYKGELFTLMVVKEEMRYILHLSLDSEDERKVWRALEVAKSGYDVTIARLKEEKEVSPMKGIALDTLISSLNF